MMARDTLAFQTLVAVARQRPGLDERRCRLVLELLSTAAALQATLLRDLGEQQLSGLKLGVLTALFALAPSPSTAADLAVHTGATRAAMTDALAQLETRGFIMRERDAADRRVVYVHLTDAGQQAAETAIVRFLTNAAAVARHVELPDDAPLLAVCAQLNEGCGQIAAAP